MVTFDTLPHRSATSQIFHQTLDIILFPFRKLSAWNKIESTRKVLSALSDHQLDDLGLTRGDIKRIAYKLSYRR